MFDSTFSTQADSSERSNAILVLGRKLVEELGLEDSTDTLSRWMAHYIAELIVQAERSTGKEKESIEKGCFEAILKLWEHRGALPGVKQPFVQLHELAQAIESLNPERETPRYFRTIRAQEPKEEEREGVEDWFKLADGLDYSARILISFCLGNAAHAAMDKSKEWIILAKAAAAEARGEELVIDFVSRAEDLLVSPDVDQENRLEIENVLSRLASFRKLAAEFAAILKKRVGKKQRRKKDELA